MEEGEECVDAKARHCESYPGPEQARVEAGIEVSNAGTYRPSGHSHRKEGEYAIYPPRRVLPIHKDGKTKVQGADDTKNYETQPQGYISGRPSMITECVPPIE